ncbi:nuclear pore complex protein Nup154 [Rhagoletis pomonella]|uniref:nuclear pore complex protein Nup154 n=1 Tax=Rhagoletis pomonella TaxID=28610 RepID=UPI00177EB3DC|nr:nuclear pore complex protein Nup154 [Rhagoletis pomonella]
MPSISPTDFLDVAGNILERMDIRDSSSPGLLDVKINLTGVAQHGFATASGLNDYDYQNLSSLSMGPKSAMQVHTVNKIPIPAEILEHFKHIKCHCMMGLFPEIGRAWLTIDSEIYIWTYEQARDVAYYDGLNHLIVSVGLAKPKPGVFISDVKYLLILTTPIEIIVLGVTFADTTKIISSPMRNMQSTTTFEEMQLMNKPIFILNSDNVAINVVQCSQNGRIFLGGRDGCLYEIDYHADSSWFGKRCKKVNHSQSVVSAMVPNFLKLFTENDPIVSIVIDDHRQLLYTLTEKGSIDAWNIGTDCSSTRRFARVSQNEVMQRASSILKTVDNSIFSKIKSICPLSIDDSLNLNLLAITQSGVRLFFATRPLSSAQNPSQQHLQQQQIQLSQTLQKQTSTNFPSTNTSGLVSAQSAQDLSKPQGLYLYHVRLPPGYTPNTTVNKPKQVHSAYYSEGTLLLISTSQQDQDHLWSISSAPFLSRPYLAEATAVLSLDGIVWSLAEVRDKCESKLNSILRKAKKAKKVVLLTNQGAHIIALLKPVDILQQLLTAYSGPHNEAVKAFFQIQTESEACTTSLLIACADQFRNTDLAIWAAQALLLYGGEPYYHYQMLANAQGGTSKINPMNPALHMGHYGVDRNTPQMFVSTPMPHTAGGGFQMPRSPQSSHTMQQTQYPLSPIPGQDTGYDGGLIVNDYSTVIYSAKHDGLYLYVARLLRPIWKKRCVDTNLCSTVTQSDCTLILEDLFSLRAFMDAYIVNDCSGLSRNTYSTQTSVSNGFSHVLPAHTQLSTHEQRNVTEQAQSEEKQSLSALYQLIKHVCEILSLWKILSEHQFQVLATQLTKEEQTTLSSCTFRDLTLTRTDSCALLIATLINSYLKDNASVSIISAKLREVCPNLYRHEDAVTFKATEILLSAKSCEASEGKNEKLCTALQLCKDAAPNLPLQNICQQFSIAGFGEGVIELTATCAAKIDPEENGIRYYNCDEPTEDTEGYAAYSARMTCYKEVRLMLDTIYQNYCNANETQEFEFQRQICDTSEKRFSVQIRKLVNLAIQIKDPLLHITLYQWLMAHDMISELLALPEPSLGEFLRRNVVNNPGNLNLVDLLWKYYEKNGRHAEAAHILDNLASTESECILLDQRIEYLARAVMCLRNDSSGFSIANGVLLKELEDKLEIARVQKCILDTFSAYIAPDHRVLQAIEKLNFTLYDITQLYQQFADPFDLWECKLTILNCSHHNDPLLIETVWSQIINKAVVGKGTTQERCTRLFTKIESLVKEFRESGHCFPLAFIIRELELKACQLQFPEGIVPEKLVAMNIDIELLMEYYFRMISMNERVWANEGNEWHLVQSSIRVVTLLCGNLRSIWHRSKRRILGKAQDIVSTCLSFCYQKPDTEHLRSSLKSLQCQLQDNLL